MCLKTALINLFWVLQACLDHCGLCFLVTFVARKFGTAVAH